MFFYHRSSGLPLVAPLAWAQPAQQDPQGFTPTVNLTMEQKHIIKETVKELKIEGVAADLEVAIGEAVPKTVQLHPMPVQLSEKISHIKNHLFFSRVLKSSLCTQRKTRLSISLTDHIVARRRSCHVVGARASRLRGPASSLWVEVEARFAILFGIWAAPLPSFEWTYARVINL